MEYFNNPFEEYFNNPYYRKFRNKYRETQPPEILKVLNKYYEVESGRTRLKPIKRKRPKFKDGDVFVFNPFGDVYFFGIVLKADVDAEAYGSNLICICMLKKYTTEPLEKITLPNIEVSDIIFEPYIIPKSYWTWDGYFYNIGETVGEDFKPDYGFYRSLHGKQGYVDADGVPIDREPEYLGLFALTSDFCIAGQIHRELIVDSSILAPREQQMFKEYLEELFTPLPPVEKVLTEFEKEVYPFSFSKMHSRRYDALLSEVELTEYESIFDIRNKGIEGNGYDWEEVIKIFIKENFAEDRKKIKFDPEAGMFCMYSSNEELMKKILRDLSKELREKKLEKYIMMAKFSEYE